MTLIALASAKGSPGVTTHAVGIAASWPAGRLPIIAELDPSGGDLAHRFGLATEPGIVSLAAAARRESVPIAEHCQQLPGGLSALIAPPQADQAAAAVAMLAQSNIFIDTAETVIADFGRLDGSSPSHAIVAMADLVIVVLRPVATDVSHVASLLASLRQRTNNIGLLVTGSGPYSADEVASALDAAPLGALPSDQTGAQMLSGGRGSQRLLGRSPLVRAHRRLAEHLSTLIPDAAPAERAS